MLPKRYRFPLRKEFSRLKRSGRIVPGRFFSLLVAGQLSQDSLLVPRFGFIVSVKVSKKATQRNRAKRLMSETIYQLIPKIKPGFDGVFLTKKTIINRNFKEIFQEVEQVFKKAEILKENFE